jgi:hypothetical protein
MAWTNTNATGEAATEGWADETRATIVKQGGRTTTNSTTGRTITLDTAETDVDDYEVLYGIVGNPGPNTGYLWPEKTTTNFTIYNSGTTTGIELWYRVVTFVEP